MVRTSTSNAYQAAKKAASVGLGVDNTAATEEIIASLGSVMDAWAADWNMFARDVLGVTLDADQQNILSSVQFNCRTTVRSGHARGKDYIAAVAAVCFLFLKCPCKVICTAPTGRQVNSIMMAEIRGLWKGARMPLGGEILQGKIRFDDPNWFLEGFKAADKDTEAWTGYHSQNLLVVVTEASGLEDDTFNAIEGLLTGEGSRILLVGNPNKNNGEFYQSFRSPSYNKFILDCMQAPNVRARRTIIPGQVDWGWVNDHVHRPGWTVKIPKEDMREEDGDFEWEGEYYRPTDLFRSRVRGMFPQVDSQRLIPMQWVELAQERWRVWRHRGGGRVGQLRLGCDIAGMGADMNCFAPRYEDVVMELEVFSKSDHMATAGRIKNRLTGGGRGFIDTIGEGAGVYSKCKEEGVRVTSVKFSESARNNRGNSMHDKTGERTFVNMRAYCYWALRDALDPQLGGCMALPPDDELAQELTEIGFSIRGNGEIIIEPKDAIKTRLGRSPDRADSIALTYYPKGRSGIVGDAMGFDWR